MKITIESTTKVVDLVDARNGSSIPARVWEGATERGVPVIACITRIAAHLEDVAEFERDLQEQRPPSLEAQAWPARLVL